MSNIIVSVLFGRLHITAHHCILLILKSTWLLCMRSPVSCNLLTLCSCYWAHPGGDTQLTSNNYCASALTVLNYVDYVKI